MNAEQVAKLFHETYERLAPAFGYSTRKSSRVEWEQVPQKNRALMVAVSQSVLNTLQDKESPATDTQQLQAKIARLSHEIRNDLEMGRTVNLMSVIDRLVQLSAVQ